MSYPSRQVPALVAMSIALAAGLSFFSPQPAHPQYAYPVVAVSDAAPEPPVVATLVDQGVDSLSIRDSRLLLTRAAAEARPQAHTAEVAPAPATDLPVPELPAVPPIVVSGVAGIVMPVNAPITSPFGLRFHPILLVVKLHTGMDLGAACGTPVAAALPGVVTFAGVDRAYGGRVVIDHGVIGGHRIATTYSHLSALGVRVGQTVVGGAGIGLVGSTGFSTGCHLHVELFVDGSFVDPAPWFRNGTITTTTLTQVVPVEQVANPIPEPEVPNQETSPLLPEAPVVSASPSATVSGTPSPSASSVTPTPSVSESGPTASASVTPSPSTAPSGSETPSPSSASSTPAPSSTSSASTLPSPTATVSTLAATSAPPVPATSAPVATTSAATTSVAPTSVAPTSAAAVASSALPSRTASSSLPSGSASASTAG